MTNRSARSVLIATALFVLGCGGSNATGTGGSGGAAGHGGAAGGSGATGTAGASGSTGASGTAGATGTAGASGTGGASSPLVLTPASFSVAMDGESTQCVVLDLGNAAPIHVGEIKTTLSPAVYEVRIGATSGSAQTTPSPCDPFGDIDSATVKPLVLARSATDDLVFPTGIGYTFAAHQLLRFEVHAYNATAGALDAAVSATFTPVPDATFQQEAGLLVFEDSDITIAAQATVSVGPVFFPLSTALGSASLFRMMGYTHKLGIDVAMRTATSATDPSPTTIYSPVWDPASPPVVTKTPPVALASPGGIALSCTWNNSAGVRQVRFGTSVVNDERCAGVVSYYPAATVHRCIHSSVGGGIVLCCPGAAGCP
jgi:hypothetical protein